MLASASLEAETLDNTLRQLERLEHFFAVDVLEEGRLYSSSAGYCR